MLLGTVRGDLYPNCRASRSEPHLVSSPTLTNKFISGSSNSSSNIARTPITPQQTMMNYARMSYRYTTVTLLSLRPQPELTIFPEHLVERRFLDDENYIDLDRMLLEKAGKFRLESYGILDGAGDGPIIPRRVHKYDFSDPVVIEKVKNRRPKDPMTPHQVAALTSVVTRHQPSALPTPLLAAHQNSHPQVWIDDYSHRQTQVQRPSYRHSLPPQPSLPYQRKNPNQCETFVNHTKNVLSNHHSTIDKNNPNQTVPILQRLFQAQKRQQNDQRKIDLELNQSPKIHDEHSDNHYQGLSTFETPVTPAQSNSANTFAWPFSTNQKAVSHPLHLALSAQTTVKQNQNILAQLINDQARCSTTIQTPATPGVDLHYANENQRMKRVDDDDDDDEQDFYSAPPSPTQSSDECSNMLDRKEKCDKANIYNQASLLNSFIRNMVQEHHQRKNQNRAGYTENDSRETLSNQSLTFPESDQTGRTLQTGDSYAEMYNLIRLISPGIKSAAQQELLQYLEQGCAIEREELIRLISSMSHEEQIKLKPVIARLIHEQLDVLKTQQDIQKSHSKSMIHRSGFQSGEIRSPLESWFGSDIYQSSYPRMPSAGVFSVGDLEESRLL